MSFISFRNSTFLRFLLSYLVILTIVFTGFYFVVQTELKQEYLARLNSENQVSLESLYNIIDSQLKSISQITLSLHQNSTILLSRYDNNNYSNYLTVGELKKYSTGNSLIYDTLFLDKNAGTILTTKRHARIREDYLEIYSGNHYTKIALDELTQATHGRLLALAGKEDSNILFIPGQETAPIVYLYDLNRIEFQHLLETGLSDGIYSISITDLDGNPLMTVKNQDADETPPESTLNYEINPYTNCFRLHAVSSKPVLFNMVNSAFRNTYWFMALIGVAGLFVIFLSMRTTYLPLRSLAKNLTGKKNTREDYYIQIKNAFEDTREEKKGLEHKINDYRIMMQRSIFDNVISENNDTQKILEKIDSLFNNEDSHTLFIAIIYTRQMELSSLIMDDLHHSLPDRSFSFQLEKKEAHIILLINYAGTEASKEEVLTMYLEEYTRRFSCAIALSNPAANPMDIPSLYENAQLAALQSTEGHVSCYSKVLETDTLKQKKHYPYHSLNVFTEHLDDLSFPSASQTLKELLYLIHEKMNAVFYTKCLLIDILTIIISAMNKNNIRFDIYKDIYLQTLFYCRSCDYTEKKKEIDSNLFSLMKIFEEETSSVALHMPLVRKFVDDSYMDSTFSVMLLASHFQISPAYMSYLFKNHTGENLTDYVWRLRLKKACELLSDTEKTIDEISLSVGYENTSSFRRKFKQETGMTPSEYKKIALKN